MRGRLSIFALLVAFLPVPAGAQSAPALPPVEAFASLPTVSGPSLSPDGKHLALIQAHNGRPVATIWTVDDLSTVPFVLPYEDGFIDGVTWANDHRLIVRINLNARVLGDNVNPWYRSVSFDIDTKKVVLLFSNKQEARDINYSASNIVALAPDDPDHIYMTLYSGGGVVLGMYYEPVNNLYRVDVNTGSAVYADIRANKSTREWFTDGNGNPVARLDQTKNPLAEHIFAYTPDKEAHEIATADATGGHGFGISGLSPDGKALVLSVSSNDSNATNSLAQMSLADGKMSPLYSNPLYDLSYAITDPWTNRVIGVDVISHRATDTYFDPKLQALQDNLDNEFMGMSVHAQTWDRAFNRIVLSVDGPVTPPTYYLFDRQTNQIKRLARAYPGLSAADLGQMRVYDYKARDGLSIPAYLTVPPNKEAKNLPVVILPHGGPMARDAMNFDWESQFLANRGYAVLQPNFRGSNGYGRKFEEAGYGQWGLKMQDDITDGVKKLIADGIADPKRICIVGGSYGGYAALAGAAFTPDLYACAAAWAPVTDLRLFLRTRSQDYGHDSWMISSWSRFIGDRSEDSTKLDAASPAENAAKIKVPVLLMHGEADATVRIDQSEAMESALRHAGKKVTFVRIPKETHDMVVAATRARWLSELETFLKTNIGN